MGQEKLAKLGIKRDNDMMYYVKAEKKGGKVGDVYATPRKKPGQPKGKSTKIADAGVELDYSKYLYFLDGDGDVARKERQVGGSKRKSKGGAKAKKGGAKKAAKKTSAKKGGGKKGAKKKKK